MMSAFFYFPPTLNPPEIGTPRKPGLIRFILKNVSYHFTRMLFMKGSHLWKHLWERNYKADI